MAIVYDFKTDNGVLRARATGKDDNLEQVISYGMAIIKATQPTGCGKILCDETALIYAPGTIDTFESARFISKHAPDVAKVAIVCRPENINDADFWETVAVNRGLYVEFFKNMADAEKWLMKEESAGGRYHYDFKGFTFWKSGIFFLNK